MSTLTKTTLPTSLLIPRRTKPINSPNNKVVFHKNDHYLNKIVPQKKKASFCIQAQAQEGEASVPSSPIESPSLRPTFVLFGSSIVEYSYFEGWGATLAHLYARQVDLIMRGYAGWNSRNALQILDRVFPKNATQQPSLVIVYFGGNDATNPRPGGNGPHVPLEEYKENMKKIVIHLQSLSEKTRVIFLSTPPINEDQIFGDSDGIHFSDEGSKVVSREILKVLREADWEPSLHWRDMPIEFEEYYTPPTGPGGEPTDEPSSRFPPGVEWD
ncbi:PREDICTED: GDSL esterase/lipase At2g38180-like isoform X2 [Lupinus angustifolius]|uniref:GDSL esterase/lipase At2g38180-like isoform X2 n=1 Tax=Lupinus angustifolius TaxID=3871 RepID=UPI00092E717E|nr:PREDICTED: GDSL esterase/lipase At2g38180-like isoform X2 [Lupinus angustifolius]